jgi:hypothetical protein
MRGRHTDVHDYEVGLGRVDYIEELAGVPGLPHDLESGAVEQAGQAFAKENVVLGDGDAARFGAAACP